MKQAGIRERLNNLTASIDTMPAGAKSTIMALVNLVEILSEKIALYEVTIQKLKDENSRLKGEQGKPNIKGDAKNGGNHSSEKERNNRGGKKPRKPKNRKKVTVKVEQDRDHRIR